MLNKRVIDNINKEVFIINNIIKDYKDKNDGFEVGIMDYSSTWQESDHYIKVEFNPSKEALIFYYWEYSKPNVIKKEEYKGLNEFDGTGLQDGRKLMRKLLRLIPKNYMKQNENKIDENIKKIVKLIESVTGKNVILTEEINLQRYNKYFQNDETEFIIENPEFSFDYQGYKCSFDLKLILRRSGIEPIYDFTINQEYYDDEYLENNKLEDYSEQARVIYLINNVFKTENNLTKYLESYYEIEIEQFFEAKFENEDGDLSQRGLSWKDFI